MPVGSSFGSSRVEAFEALLTANAIPFTGTSVSGDAPAGIIINFAPSATAEQIAWANDQKDNVFDWRRRRPLARNTIVTTIAGLTTAQQNTIVRHIAAFIARQNPDECANIAAVLGVSFPVDEVDPTETVPS